MEMVRLKTGEEVGSPLVWGTMLALRNLFENDPICFYELVMMCRDRNHKPWGNTTEVLKEKSLMLPSGGIHEAIRTVVLCAVEGEGLEMRLGNPLPQAAEGVEGGE